MSNPTVLTRADWGFKGPLGPAEMTLPSAGVWVHHSVTNETDDPAADMRRIENIGLSRFGRLSYSWAIHPSGVILQGQGNHIGAHTHKQNSKSHGVVFIGDYRYDQFTRAQQDSFVWLMKHGGTSGWWKPIIIGPHSANPYSSTTCPGDNIRDRLGDLQERIDMSDTHTHKVSSEVPPKDWGDEAWQWFVANGFTSYPPSRTWEARREDLAWALKTFLEKFPPSGGGSDPALRAELDALKKEVSGLRAHLRNS